MTTERPDTPARETIRVEDDRTGMHPVTLERAVLDHLYYTCARNEESATLFNLYNAIAHTTRNRLVHRWVATSRAYQKHSVKRVYYLSAEYLLGRMLHRNLVYLGLYETAKELLAERGLSLEEIVGQEHDPGLGNGGLGRLAACFMDSLATLELPAVGYGIRYEFGIFHQVFQDGWQIEQGDAWLAHGCPWEVARHDYTAKVKFYGRVQETVDLDGNYVPRWIDTHTVLGVPYDYPCPGYHNNTVNTLRLWAARASREFNLQVFNDGDYRRAVEEKALSESISKVLYPKDTTLEGKELRLKQQYFFVACSIHDIMRRFKREHSDLATFPDHAAIQLNDTHPAVAVAELMRVFIDLEGLTWAAAWDITCRTVGYTNHTLLSEALERWPVSLFGQLLPRHLQIIYEINARFLRQVAIRWPGDEDRLARMSIIEEGGGHKQIRMAHLAVVGSHSVNGVAALHSRLVRENLLPDFATFWPERFNNKTNGVTPRRWLLLCNPKLAKTITRQLGNGDDWVKDADQLSGLAAAADNISFLDQLRSIKRKNKERLAQTIRERMGLEIDPDSLFDVQVKRIHQYKRQLMNCLHIIHRYILLKADPTQDVVPRTFIFGGKAAPGYVSAKLQIKLINAVAEVVNQDPAIAGRIKVAFIPNYDVSLAEIIIPAADVSEQISMAGKEASGTGNMKFAMNGALTVGTLDGANVEIRERVGADNFFLFGLDTAEVKALKAAGYDPAAYIDANPALSAVIDLIASGFFSPDARNRFAPILDDLRHVDTYLIAADFDDYCRVQDDVDRLYRDPVEWQRKVVANIANMGFFSSDRTIRQYADEIWGITSCPVTLDD